MGERTDEIRDYADSEPEEYSPLSQTGGTGETVDTFRPDYSLSEDTAEDSPEAETEAIREDIEQTRAEMARTVDEIQARLTPQNIMEHVKETAKETASEAIDNVKQTVHDATVGKVENMVNSVSTSARETSSGLMGVIKENPIPSALVGLGLGWLYMKRQGNSANKPSQVPPAFAGQTGYMAAYPYSYAPVTPSSAPVAYTPTAYSSPSSNQSGGGIVDKIVQNPIPVAVAGASIDYLLMKGPSQSSGSTGYASYNYNNSYGSQSGIGQVKDKVGDVMGQAGSKVGDIASNTAGTVGDVASGTAETVGNVASGAAEEVGNVASGAGDVAGNVVGGVQQGAQKATTQLERMLHENPLLVGGAALVLGAVIGMMLPATEKENQILGKAHDTVMEKAGDVVQQTMDKVSNVAEEVTNTVKEETKNQGLTQ